VAPRQLSQHPANRNESGGGALCDLMLPAAIVSAALLITPATAAAAPAVEKSPDLWATVNVCDTAASPDKIGIRGSMPGLGKRSDLFMRFQVHYFAKADGKWHNIEDNADKLMKLGSASKRVLESGYTFKFKPPPDGGAHTMRGAVTFVWKRKGRVVKKVREITEAGHRSTKGAEPPGFSAATCQIS
jgi:hypothetical protein